MGPSIRVCGYVLASAGVALASSTGSASERVGISRPASAARTRRPALTRDRDAGSRARAAGRCACSTAMNVATNAAPTAPPSVRITAFIPLATPVCVRGTASTIRLPSAAKASPTPMPEQRRGRRRSATAGVWATSSSTKLSAVATEPTISAAFEPKRCAMRPGEEAHDQHRHRERQQVEAGLDDRRAEPVAGAARLLDELRDDQEQHVQAAAEQRRREVRASRPARSAHQAHVDERRRALRTSQTTQRGADDEPAAIRPSVFGDPQPQLAASLTAISTAEMPTRHQRRRDPVDLRRRAHRRRRDQEVREHRGEQRSGPSGSQNSQCQLRCSEDHGRRARCRRRRRCRASRRRGRCSSRRAGAGTRRARCRS